MRYGISSLDEARAYLAHPVLGPRLRECARLVAHIERPSADDIFGWPDNLKVRSSMTLFARATDDNADFRAVLDKFYDGGEDEPPSSAARRDDQPAVWLDLGLGRRRSCGGAPEPATIRPSPKPRSGSESVQRPRRRR